MLVHANILGRLTRALEAPVVLADGARAHIGASIGVARSPGDGRTLDMLLAAADRAMYALKRARHALAPVQPRPA